MQSSLTEYQINHLWHLKEELAVLIPLVRELVDLLLADPSSDESSEDEEIHEHVTQPLK